MLTLCMIAKDEETLLPGLLASVRGVVDRIVLVDTGSKDKTVKIAKDAGAHIIHHPWTQDFAAARNAALAGVKKGWILVLDADERLAPGAGAALKAALHRPDFDYALLPLHNASHLQASPADILSGRARQGAPALLARLFHYDPDLRWEGVIHERPARWMEKKRGGQVNVPILHLGYAAEWMKSKDKHARNLPLLQKRIEGNPDDYLSWMYLGRELGMLGREAEASAALAQGWARVEQRLQKQEAVPFAVGLATLWGQSLLARGDAQSALDIIQRLNAAGVQHPNLLWLAGRCLLWQGMQGQPSRFPMAINALQATLNLGEVTLAEPLVEGVGGWRSALDLSTLWILLGQPEKARPCLDIAAQAAPEAVRLGRLECLLDENKPLQAIEGLISELEAATPASDPWAIAALAAFGLGMEREGDRWAKEALQRRRWSSMHRQYRLSATLCRRQLLSGKPLAGPGPYGALGRLLLGQAPAQAPEIPLLILQDVLNKRPELREDLHQKALAAGWTDVAAQIQQC